MQVKSISLITNPTSEQMELVGINTPTLQRNFMKYVARYFDLLKDRINLSYEIRDSFRLAHEDRDVHKIIHNHFNSLYPYDYLNHGCIGRRYPEYWRHVFYVAIGDLKNVRMRVGGRYVSIRRLLNDMGCRVYADDKELRGYNGYLNNKILGDLVPVGTPILSILVLDTSVVYIEFESELDVSGVYSALSDQFTYVDDVPYEGNIRDGRCVYIQMDKLRSVYINHHSGSVSEYKNVKLLRYMGRLWDQLSKSVVVRDGIEYGRLCEESYGSGDRYYTRGISVMNMPKTLRSELLEDHVEYDLNSAAIVWAINSAKQFNIDTASLEVYVENKTMYREGIVEEMLSDQNLIGIDADWLRDSVKRAFLAILFGGRLTYTEKSIRTYLHEQQIPQIFIVDDRSSIDMDMTINVSMAFKNSLLVQSFFTELSSIYKEMAKLIRVYNKKKPIEINILGLKEAIEANPSSKSNSIIAAAYRHYETQVMNTAISELESLGMIDRVITPIHDAIIVKPVDSFVFDKINDRLAIEYGDNVKLSTKSVSVSASVEVKVESTMNVTPSVVQEEVKSVAYEAVKVDTLVPFPKCGNLNRKIIEDLELVLLLNSPDRDVMNLLSRVNNISGAIDYLQSKYRGHWAITEYVG